MFQRRKPGCGTLAGAPLKMGVSVRGECKTTLPLPRKVGHLFPAMAAEENTMPKGFNLRCSAGKTARGWLQEKGGALAPGQVLVLLPIRPGETHESPVAYRAPCARR